MKSRKSGRGIGTLLFVQLVGLIFPFVLLLPLSAGPDAYLSTAAAIAPRIPFAVALLFLNGALTVAIAISIAGLIRQRSGSFAMWLLAASVMMFLLQAIDNVQILSLLSLSQEYVRGAGSTELLATLATAVASTRRWAHVSELLFIDCWMFSMYLAVYRFELAARRVALFGMATVLMHFAGIPARAFVGYSPITSLGVPMAVSHVTLAIWLIVRGIGMRDRPSHAAPRGAGVAEDRLQMRTAT